MSYDQRLLQPNRKTIFLDLDNTIADWTSGYHNYARKYASTTYPDAKAFKDLEDGNHKHSRWLDRFGSEFWNQLEWLPWGKDLYQYCKSLCPTIILTAPTLNPTSAMGKMQWLNREIGSRDWVISGCKQCMASQNNLLLDDSEKFVSRWLSAGGPAILFKPENLEPIKRTLHEFVLGP